MSRQRKPELPELSVLQPELRDWFATELGQQLLARERQLLDEWMPRLFGYHLLQVSALGGLDLTERSPAGHRFVLAPSVASTLDEHALVAQIENLPLANECIDAVVLHHVLEFSPNPHQALREAVRVLKPGGRLLIVGFNPLSLWGLQRLWRQRSGQAPWSGRFMTHRRIHDWMKLLEMKCEPVQSGFYRPAWQRQRWMNAMGFCDRWGERSGWPVGAFWVLTGCKESYSVTPISRSWRRRFAFPLASVRPTSSGSAGRAAARIYAEGEVD